MLKDGSVGSTRRSESFAKMHGAALDELMSRALEIQKKVPFGAHGAALTSLEAMGLGVYRRDNEPVAITNQP